MPSFGCNLVSPTTAVTLTRDFLPLHLRTAHVSILPMKRHVIAYLAYSDRLYFEDAVDNGGRYVVLKVDVLTFLIGRWAFVLRCVLNLCARSCNMKLVVLSSYVGRIVGQTS